MYTCTGIYHIFLSENSKRGSNSIKEVWVIDQAWGQDGRILAKFFLYTQKKNEANI